MKRKTRNQLEVALIECRASKPIAYHLANVTIDKASTDRMMGSGVLLHITSLVGTDIINPVMISDGLSQSTIDAIKADIKRSYDHATEFKA